MILEVILLPEYQSNTGLESTSDKLFKTNDTRNRHFKKFILETLCNLRTPILNCTAKR